MTRFSSMFVAALVLLVLANCAPNRATISEEDENELSEGLNPFTSNPNSNPGSSNPNSTSLNTDPNANMNTGTNTNTNNNTGASGISESQVQTMINAMSSQDRAVWTAALESLGQTLTALARSVDDVWRNLTARVAVFEGLNIANRLSALEGGTRIPMYRCPTQGGGSLGGGDWGFYGCLGQIQSNPTCFTVEWPRQSTQQCTFIGNITVK